MKLWDFILLKLKKEFEDHIADGHPFAGGVPIGTIVIWFSNDIPDGWALCDGNGGNPDLQNYFLYGAPSAEYLGESGVFTVTGSSFNMRMVHFIIKL